MSDPNTKEQEVIEDLLHRPLDICLIAFTIIYNFIILVVATLWIFTNKFEESKKGLTTLTNMKIDEGVTYALFFSGMLGGSFYCLRAIYLRLSAAYPEQKDPEKAPLKVFNIRVWLFWYLFRPWQGGILALVIMCLINGDFLTAKSLEAGNLKSFYTLIAIGFFAGLGTQEVIQKIQEIIAVIFSRSKVAEH